MSKNTEFIFMLTKADETIQDARKVLASLAQSGLRHVGFKDNGISVQEMHNLVSDIREIGAQVHLEVVSLAEQDELTSANMAVELGVDYLIGGIRPNQVLGIVSQTQLKYFPYVGKIVGHPAILEGSIQEIIDDAKALPPQVDGINLLAYRHSSIPGGKVLEGLVQSTDLPVISAGSIDSITRIVEVKDSGAWAFTVGTAALDGAFVPGGSLQEQISAILKAAA